MGFTLVGLGSTLVGLGSTLVRLGITLVGLGSALVGLGFRVSGSVSRKAASQVEAQLCNFKAQCKLGFGLWLPPAALGSSWLPLAAF